MSEANEGGENAQNSQEGGENAQNTVNQRVSTDKIWSAGYNNGIEKGAEREREKIKKKLKGVGVEAENFDQFLETFKEKSESSKQSKGELEELRNKLKEEQAQREQALNQLNGLQRQIQLDRASDQAFGELSKSHDFKIPQNAIKTLFTSEYDIQEENGNLYAVKKGSETPVLADNGDKKALSNVMQDFVRAQELITPKAQGAGGGTGSSVTGGKPKLSEFHSLLKKGKQEEAAKLYDRQKELGGWATEE